GSDHALAGCSLSDATGPDQRFRAAPAAATAVILHGRDACHSPGPDCGPLFDASLWQIRTCRLSLRRADQIPDRDLPWRTASGRPLTQAVDRIGLVNALNTETEVGSCSPKKTTSS